MLTLPETAMPVYADLDTFKSLVKDANWHHEWFKNGSLHNLVQLLKKNSTAKQVRDAVDVIPADKQLKYTAALDHLKATFPGYNPVVAPPPVTGGVRVVVPTTGQAGLRTVAPGASNAPTPALPPARGLATVVTPLATQGYNLIADPLPITLLPVGQRVPAFTRAQIQRINEAIARCKRAVELAVDAIAAVTAPVPMAPLNATQALYTDFFGAYDITRRATVRDNFLSIGAVLGGVRGGRAGTLNLVDSRNDQEKYQWFAATYRNSAAGGAVKMYVGREFFAGGGSYDVSSDATVVTVVHELAHACFGASDVPTVGSGQVLDGTGMPPRGAAVCNDLASDKALAARYPDRALLNADNYGQFAWLALRAGGE
jgi:hypothetical protein